MLDSKVKEIRAGKSGTDGVSGALPVAISVDVITVLGS